MIFWTHRGRLMTNVVVGRREELNPHTGIARVMPVNYNVKFGQKQLGVFNSDTDIVDKGLSAALGISEEELRERIENGLKDSKFFGKEYRIMDQEVVNSIKLPEAIVKEKHPEARKRAELVETARKSNLGKGFIDALPDNELEGAIISAKDRRIAELEAMLGDRTEVKEPIAKEAPERGSKKKAKKPMSEERRKQLAANLAKAREARKKKLDAKRN